MNKAIAHDTIEAGLINNRGNELKKTQDFLRQMLVKTEITDTEKLAMINEKIENNKLQLDEFNAKATEFQKQHLQRVKQHKQELAVIGNQSDILQNKVNNLRQYLTDFAVAYYFYFGRTKIINFFVISSSEFRFGYAFTTLGRGKMLSTTL